MADAVGDYEDVCCELYFVFNMNNDVEGLMGGEGLTVSNPILLRIKVMYEFMGTMGT